jgi:TonB family protein
VARAKGEGITERVSPLETGATVAKNTPAAPRAAEPSAAQVPAADAVSTAATASAATADAAPASAAVALAAPSVAEPAPKPEPEADVPLVLVHQVDPEFPAAVLRRLQKGSVQVRFEVQPDGSVKQPEVVKSSNAKLNPAALEAVAQWKFQPVRRTQYGMVELAFNLE